LKAGSNIGDQRPSNPATDYVYLSRLNMRWTKLAAAISIALLVGCGSDSGKSSGPITIDDNSSPNGATTDSGGNGGTDAGSGADAGEDAGQNTGQDAGTGCAFSGFEPAVTTAERSDRLLVLSDTSGSPNETLFFRSLDPNPGAGVLDFQAASFADCDPCLFIQTGCADELCEETFQAREGSVEIVDSAQNFRARLSSLELVPVSIDDEGAVTVLDGEPYCLGELELSAPIEEDPCEGMPDPVLTDVNCGPAPLTVTYDLNGVLSQFERFDSAFIDFGDGESWSSFRDTVVSHTYREGDWDAEVIIRGSIANSAATLESPVPVRAYAP
jgi:hypothetical protein